MVGIITLCRAANSVWSGSRSLKGRLEISTDARILPTRIIFVAPTAGGPPSDSFKGLMALVAETRGKEFLSLRGQFVTVCGGDGRNELDFRRTLHARLRTWGWPIFVNVELLLM